jgi:hypothetical protein
VPGAAAYRGRRASTSVGNCESASVARPLPRLPPDPVADLPPAGMLEAHHVAAHAPSKRMVFLLTVSSAGSPSVRRERVQSLGESGHAVSDRAAGARRTWTGRVRHVPKQYVAVRCSTSRWSRGVSYACLYSLVWAMPDAYYAPRREIPQPVLTEPRRRGVVPTSALAYSTRSGVWGQENETRSPRRTSALRFSCGVRAEGQGSDTCKASGARTSRRRECRRVLRRADAEAEASRC